MPTIHGVNASPFVRKVRVAMLEKGLDYDLEPVMPIGVSDEFKKLSPLGKIPVQTSRSTSVSGVGGVSGASEKALRN